MYGIHNEYFDYFKIGCSLSFFGSAVVCTSNSTCQNDKDITKTLFLASVEKRIQSALGVKSQE
jgi:hypothetical protein